MAIYVGVPMEVARWLSTAAIAIGLVAVALLRHRPAWAFGAVVLTMIYGSPSVSIDWYVLLYALLAPLAWPLAAAEATATGKRRADPVPAPLTS